MTAVNHTIAATGPSQPVASGQSGRVAFSISSITTSVTAELQIEVGNGGFVDFATNVVLSAVGAVVVDVPRNANVRIDVTAISGSADLHIQSD